MAVYLTNEPITRYSGLGLIPTCNPKTYRPYNCDWVNQGRFKMQVVIVVCVCVCVCVCVKGLV